MLANPEWPVQIIENWADIVGRVTAVKPHPTLKDYVLVEIQVDQVTAVAGFANLFADAVGHTMIVNVAATPDHPALQNSRPLRWRIRKGGPDSAFIAPQSLL